MKKHLLIAILALTCLSAQSQLPQYFMPLGTSNNVFPFGSTTNKVNWLYYPSDFTALPPTGFITKLYFRSWSGTYSVTYTDLTIKMGSTSITSFTSAAWTPGLTQVFYASSHAVAVGPQTWWSVTLNTPFYYDNTQNLVLEISQTAYSGSMIANCAAASGNRRVWGTVSGGATSFGTTMGDLGFDLFVGFPCTDSPKSLLAAPSKVCPKVPFTVQPATYYANATYQWQYSHNGSTWSNYIGNVGLYGEITDAITDPKYYRCKIICNATPALNYTTPAKMVGIAPFYYCYCNNRATATTGLDVGNAKADYVPSVPGATIPGSTQPLNNGTGTPQTSNNTASKVYSAFMDVIDPVILYRDSSYKFTITAITSASALPASAVAVFLDWNRDGMYGPGEKMVEQITPVSGVVTQTITIPSTAEIGLTGLRVIAKAGGLPVDSCGNYGEGETEDYLADIRYEPCNGPVNPGTIASSDTSVCKDYDYTVVNIDYEKRKSNFNRQWQISADNKLWFDVTPDGYNTDMLARTFNGQPVFYKVRNICLSTNDTTYTPEALINLKAPYKCYCFSQSVGGKFLDSSDIGGFSLASVVTHDGGAHLQNIKAVNKRTDHTDEQPIQIDADSIYKLTVFHTLWTKDHADAKVTVFMDFNNDHKYRLPDGDRVYLGYTSFSTFTLIDNVVVPPTAIMNVPTGMRIILNNDIGPNVPSDDGCGVYTSGETEDYMITFHRKNTSVQEINGIRELYLYPNPTTGKFMLSLDNKEAAKEITMTVQNATGQVVKKDIYNLVSGIFTKEIDMSEFAKGVYLVELSSGSEKMMKKLVIR
jgi:hypothetical protein